MTLTEHRYLSNVRLPILGITMQAATMDVAGAEPTKTDANTADSVVVEILG